MRFATRAAWKRLGVLALAAVLLLAWARQTMLAMPGKRAKGPLPAVTDAEGRLAAELRADVTRLAGDIGDRNIYKPEALARAAVWIEGELRRSGYKPARQSFDAEGLEVCNVEVELPGGDLATEILVVGAHYDSVPGCPAANDNGSGVAATLALARAMRAEKPRRTIRFVLFVNEEPPFFQTQFMGSRVYAKRCKERGENIIGMISLETIGYYSDEDESQMYPFGGLRWVYGKRGDFIAFVGNLKWRGFVQRTIAHFREVSQFPSEGAALPAFLQGVGWSDHWSFWQEGYPALMVTDTAPFRYPHYHRATDTPDKLDYEKMARVVAGLEEAVRRLANEASGAK
ncbi:MAG: M28 family peptidase [Planctomycetota bacterium]